MTQLLALTMLLGTVVDTPFLQWRTEPVGSADWPESQGERLGEWDVVDMLNGRPVPPFSSVTVAVRLDDGTIWAGTRHGVMWRAPYAVRWRLFHSRRWLPDDHVLDLAVGKQGDVWVKTEGGTVRLVQREQTLSRKITSIHDELRRRHLRYGLVGAIQLQTPGNLDDGWSQADDDNDGLWTSLYVASEAFRFAVTGDEQARENAWLSLKALMFLEKITEHPGFVARSVVPIDIDKEGQFPWQRSSDGKWWWKGDTSSDELVGHFFAYAVYFDCAATASQKQEIRAVVGRIIDHILDHNFQYIDPQGRRTRWGMWTPEVLNRDPQWINERGINSLEILSFLKVAHHITGRARYAEVARRLIDQHGYAMNTVRQKMTPVDGENNHSDDELAFLAYYPLLQYEQDPALRAIYLFSLERSWRVERPERSPLFNYIYGASLQASHWADPSRRPSEPFVPAGRYDSDLCIQWFQDVPTDLLRWTVINSTRHDIGQVTVNRQGRPCSQFVLPVSERPLMRWNGDPYALDGGNGGRERDDGTFILLPYWMGRYHRLLPE